MQSQKNQFNLNNVNNILIECPNEVSTKMASTLTCGLVKCRSIVNKTQSLQVELINNRINSHALIKTWIKQEDNTTSTATYLNGYKAINNSRPSRTGGGIAIVHQKELNVSNVKMFRVDTMECADLKISATTEADKHLILIYQPPHINVLPFINDLAKIMKDQITSSGESIILGDSILEPMINQI